MVELKSYIYSRRIKINFRQVSQFVLLDTFNSMSLGRCEKVGDAFVSIRGYKSRSKLD